MSGHGDVWEPVRVRVGDALAAKVPLGAVAGSDCQTQRVALAPDASVGAVVGEVRPAARLHVHSPDAGGVAAQVALVCVAKLTTTLPPRFDDDAPARATAAPRRSPTAPPLVTVLTAMRSAGPPGYTPAGVTGVPAVIASEGVPIVTVAGLTLVADENDP
jgi:hypothetical protein